MPLKTWAPYDRLLAEDLNAAYRYSAGEGAAVGAVCKVAGPVVAAPVANTRTEVQLGTPPAGSDPLGFFNAATKRMRVPTGYAGVYLITAGVNMTSSAAAATPAPVQWDIQGGTLAGPIALGGFSTFNTTTAVGMIGAIVLPLVDLEELWVSVTQRTVAGINAFCPSWSITRLAPYLGAIGA